MVDKTISVILTNHDNQTIIVKVNNSNDNMNISRHVKKRLNSVGKLKTPES